MKAFKLLALALATAGVGSPVLAQSATKDVNVAVTLTSVCRFTTSTALNLNATYTAFQTTAAEPTGTVGVECTRGASAPTLSFDATVGVLAGLTYQMSTTYTQTAAGAAPAGTLATDLGSARTADVVVKASFPAGQAGGSGAASATRVLTVAF